MTLPTGFSSPSLSTLIDRIEDDINTRLPGEEAKIRGSILWVLARVMAGGVFPLYKLVSWSARQVLPDTASDDQLKRWAFIYGLSSPGGIPGTRATGTTEFSGTPGTEIPAGTVVVREDGERYDTDALATIGGGETVDVTIHAIDAGDAANQDTTGITLELESPISGVDTESTTQTTLTGGTDDESIESLRDRLLARTRNPPQGGAVADYVTWAKEALSTVDNVWVYPNEPSIGSVTVRFSLQWDGSTPSSVVPSGPGAGTDVETVDDYLQSVRPVTANVVTEEPQGRPVNMDITLYDEEQETRDNIETELNAMFQREARPSGAATPETLRNGVVQAAIARAWEKYELTNLDGDLTGDDDISISDNELLYLGSIDWTAA